MLLGKPQRQNEPLTEKKEDSLLLILFVQGRYSEAFQLLDQQTVTLPNLYNKALCLYFAQIPDHALLLVDQAFACIPSQLKEISQTDSSILNKIKEKQRENKDHLQPVNDFYTTLFPLQVWDNLWRIKIDCLVQLEQWEEIITHAPKLIEKHKYQNIVYAIELAQQNKIKANE